jgi:tetratricopeptide (TPR) repeat protein
METLEQIDRYLDRTLTSDEAIELEQNLQADAESRNLFDKVTVVRDAVRSSALRSRVRNLHMQLIDEMRQQDEAVNDVPYLAKIRPLRYAQSLRWGVRVAASGLFLLAGYSGYKYGTTNIDSYYSDKFMAYQLPNNRGEIEEAVTSLDALYRAGNFSGVVQRFAGLSFPNAHDQFLTGMAYMQQQQYKQAIERFIVLQQSNDLQEKSLFEQEIDYYLALAFLGSGRVGDAYPLFEKINKTPRHMYHQNVTDEDLWKLGLLRWKSN